MYPKYMESACRKEVYTPMITAALLTIAKVGKLPQCPSMDDWIRKHDVHIQ
jgi:hypothetical protein